MNKLFLFIFIIGIILLYYLNQNNYKLEKFKWAWGYYPSISQSKELPSGTWKETCTIQDFREPLLWALCENDYGKYKETSINIDKCIDKKIRNVNGILECD